MVSVQESLDPDSETEGPFVSIETLNRRRFLQVGGLTAGGTLLPRRSRSSKPAKPTPTHVMSLIGEYAADGAYISSVVHGGMPIDLAVSTFADLSDYRLVGVQPASSDSIYRHDLAGGLLPGSQYYARLVSRHKLFGRTLSFRTRGLDAEPSKLLIGLVSCQRNSRAVDPTQPGWARLAAMRPDLLLHMGDYGYWGGVLGPLDPYMKHLAHYIGQTTALHVMRGVVEAMFSLIQVSDHETSGNNQDTWNDPVVATALEAYFRLMPFRSFDDPTRRSRFLSRKLDTNTRLIAPDFRSLERSPHAMPDTILKSAYGEVQFALLVDALKQPEPVKVLLSDPGCSPADPPTDPNDDRLWDKWCNYRTAFQRMVDVISNESTYDGKPIQVDVWSGDRHVLGVLDRANNPWGPFDVLTSSGIDQDANGLLAGELYDQVFGARGTVPHNKVKQHMEIEWSDDKVGTITRVAHGIDNVTGTEVMHHERTFTYEMTQ